jgi:hypothetical protein
MWPRQAVTSYHVIHPAQVDDATILRVTAFLRHRRKDNATILRVTAFLCHRRKDDATIQRVTAFLCHRRKDDATILRVTAFLRHRRKDDATLLRVTAFLCHRLKTLKRERRRPYNISCCNVLSRRLEKMFTLRAAYQNTVLLLFWPQFSKTCTICVFYRHQHEAKTNWRTL